ncbi:MAG: hypothetical protein ACLR30_12400 [[Clostridium] leptum]
MVETISARCRYLVTMHGATIVKGRRTPTWHRKYMATALGEHLANNLRWHSHFQVQGAGSVVFRFC